MTSKWAAGEGPSAASLPLRAKLQPPAVHKFSLRRQRMFTHL